LAIVFYTHLTYADIYKWIDKDGKVHFGDHPKEKNAETVEESKNINVMSDNSAPKQASPLSNTSQTDAELKKEANERKALASKKEKCQEIAKLHEKMNGTTDKNGRPMYTYLSVNGKSLTEKEHKATIEQLATEMKKMHCNKVLNNAK
jgi:hypothetical protein